MGLVSLTTITNGTLADAGTVMGNLNALANQVNGHIDGTNLEPSLATILGASTPSIKASGSCIIPGQEGANNYIFGPMPTPDKVAAISVGTAGLLAVFYQATWQESIAQQARAAIFIGGGPGNTQSPAQQLKAAAGVGGQPSVQSAFFGTVTPANTFAPLSTFPLGLQSGSISGAYNGDATTGQAIGANSGNYQASSAFLTSGAGGACLIRLPAGTYDVAVLFTMVGGSGTVTVKDRKLFVKALGF